MHLLMPLMDATRMELMVPGIIVTLLDSTSLYALSTCLRELVMFQYIIMLHAILLEFCCLFFAAHTRKTCLIF